MNSRLFLICLLALAMIYAVCLPVTSRCAAAASLSRTDAYNPKITYPGSFVPTMLYLRNFPSSPWRRGLKGLFSRGVSCRDALTNLGRSGLWQGHLNPDGSCGPLGEPSEWALGNRLNYQTMSGNSE